MSLQRSDFMSRGEPKVDFLRLWTFIEPWARSNHELSASDLKMLLFLDPLDWFTVKEFKEGTLWMSWEPKKIYRLINEGWVKKTHSGRGRIGGHNKYKVTQRGNLLVRRIYKMLIGKEPIPESAKRNQRVKGERHTQFLREINRRNEN